MKTIENSEDAAKNEKQKIDKEDGFVKVTKNQERKDEKSPTRKSNPSPSKDSKSPSKKKVKKGIFVSYSPDSGFVERKFVVETIKQLKENNLAEDIWFDKDERNTDSPCWFSLRMEAVEKCKAAILILSESYFTCPVSMYEAKTLIERTQSDPHAVKIFPVLFSLPPGFEIPKTFDCLLHNVIDLHKGHDAKVSLAEKTSIVIGALMSDIERYASMHVAAHPSIPPDSEFTGEYKNKKICQWTPNDLQEWLFKLGIKEFYRQSLAESMVDGFLLMSLTDQDMVQHLGRYTPYIIYNKIYIQISTKNVIKFLLWAVCL